MILTKAQQLVLRVIQANEGVQNDETKLLEAVWYFEGWDDSKSLYWNLSRVTHPETISRARRKLHELGLISYSKDAERARYEAYKKDTNTYSDHEQTEANIVSPRMHAEFVDGETIMIFDENNLTYKENKS